MHKYRELKVWQKGLAFTVTIYRETRSWSSDEKFGLISQVRRASYSIPMNIAEGAGNNSDKEFCRYLEMALRSGYKVMTAIDIARGLEFLPTERADCLIKEVDEMVAMLVGLVKSLGWRGKQRAE